MWEIKKPSYADHIRVNRGLYHHHGIYANDDCVFQFAAMQGDEISVENAIVHITTLDNFLRGGILEVRTYSTDEEKNKRSKEEIINHAKSELGNKGYDLINNNCEHFANRCVFGVSKSNQVEDILSLLGGLFR